MAHSSTNAQGALLEKVLSIVERENLVKGMDETKKVIDFVHPEELKKILQLDIRREGRSLEEVEQVLETVVRYSVKTQHPHFYNQLYGGIDEVALAGAWLTEALNTNQHTFEVAPVFTLVEHFILNRLVELFDWQDGDGIFSPGGSMSNMYGMVLARYRKNPEVKKLGLSSMKPLVAFTSDQSHYSIGKAASWMGLGLDNVIKVETDSWGRMIPESLREEAAKARLKGGDPFFVNATSGTTVFGAFDPLDQLADVCRDENLWLHVDACWGGTAIVSRKHRHLLHGIHSIRRTRRFKYLTYLRLPVLNSMNEVSTLASFFRADSVVWNPHKMLGVPLQCSAFLVRHKGLLHESNSASATYLFQQDKFYDVSYDTGDKSFQCGRKVDAFKLYFLLTCHGMDEMERRVDGAFRAAEYLAEQVAQRPGFRPVLESAQCTNTCFWYIPPSLRHQQENTEWWLKVEQPVPEKGLVNFFRMVITCYPEPQSRHMDSLLNEMDTLGADL
ncbi:Acidic amino acid decarboxylase GADL1 [Chionoecetes opilio]|uniref:Acidic amino acid decarboxylase GADL1 n=1 Tax=Chionoecetes opilio TaxID=41210 RepID=A0A8J4YAY2_CHIOP|nr:Acidic amino acid decarboxylase GADL1 [Chionoecetes opilio]